MEAPEEKPRLSVGHFHGGPWDGEHECTGLAERIEVAVNTHARPTNHVYILVAFCIQGHPIYRYIGCE